MKLQSPVSSSAFCNTVVSAPTEQPGFVMRLITGESTGDPSTRPVLQIGVEHPTTDRLSAIDIDAATGRTLTAKIQPEDRPLLDAILASMRVDQAAPVFWPYGDGVQEEPVYAEQGSFRHRYPDPGAGVVLLMRTGFGGYPALLLVNCQSRLTLQGNASGGIDDADYSEVAREDRAAFERFAAEVEYVEYVEDEALRRSDSFAPDSPATVTQSP